MKRVWFDIHRWVGLKLSIVLSFVLITGTLATISHEIDWLIDPARRVLPSYQTENYDWQGMYDAAVAERPNWAFNNIIKPLDPWFAAEIIGTTPEGELRRLLINPRTLDVQGDRPWFNAQRLFRDTHRRLMIFHSSGIILVSSLALLLLISLVSGLIIYKKFWRGFFKKPRNRNSRTLWGDLHRLGGVWSIWFIFLIVFTGLWYLIEASGNLLDIRVEGYVYRPTTIETSANKPTVSLNVLAAESKQQIPDFDPILLELPAFADNPVVFSGQASAFLTRERANYVSFDPYTGEVLDTLDARTLRIPQRISEMADPLHFGTFGGLPTKLLYFIFGIILSGMSLSGIYIYSSRIRKSLQQREKNVPETNLRAAE